MTTPTDFDVHFDPIPPRERTDHERLLQRAGIGKVEYQELVRSAMQGILSNPDLYHYLDALSTSNEPNVYDRVANVAISHANSVVYALADRRDNERKEPKSEAE